MKILLSAASAALIACSAHAGALKLTPADPQPDAGDLTPGLAVKYAEASVRSLSEAEPHLRKASPGKPLTGLDYRDTIEGDETLTSGQAMKIVAGITGYVRFDEAGTYAIDFLSNDGLQMVIGGQEVAYLDGTHPCEASEPVEAIVPVAGWYELEGLYFQRKGTACLHMRAGIGEADWMPNEAFAH